MPNISRLGVVDPRLVMNTFTVVPDKKLLMKADSFVFVLNITSIKSGVSPAFAGLTPDLIEDIEIFI